jgi:RimJ/RimL family protein N-acetyltransferase
LKHDHVEARAMSILLDQTIRLRDQRQILIRCAQQMDVPAIADLHELAAREGRFFATTFFPDRAVLESSILSNLPALEATDAFEVLALAQASKQSPPIVVADALIARRREEMFSHTAELRLILHNSWRGVGLGSAVLRAALRWARVTHVEKVDIAVRASNSSIRSLLTTFGFTPDGRRRAQYRNGDAYEDQHWYALFLRPITPDR